MLANFLLVAVGIVTILWSRWLLPWQMRAARMKGGGEQQNIYDEMIRYPGARKVLAVVAILGGLLVILGIAFWLTE